MFSDQHRKDPFLSEVNVLRRLNGYDSAGL